MEKELEQLWYSYIGETEGMFYVVGDGYQILNYT